eukprot:g12482.t1
MASPSSEGPGSQEKLPRSTPKRLSNSRTWSSPRNMDWLKEDDADSAESASPAVSPGSRVFFLGIKNSPDNLNTSNSPGARMNWRKNGVMVDTSKPSSLKKLRRTPPKQLRKVSSESTTAAPGTGRNSPPVEGLADPTLLSRVDALIEKSRQRDEWENISGFRSRRNAKDISLGEEQAGAANLNFTPPASDTVGMNENHNVGEGRQHNEQMLSKSNSLKSISESLYLHEKCGRLHRALFMTSHNVETKVSTSKLTLLLEDAQEAAEQSYRALMQARRDLLTSYLGNDAAEAMLANAKINKKAALGSPPDNMKKSGQDDLNSPSGRMETLRSTLQQMVALPHAVGVTLEKQKSKGNEGVGLTNGNASSIGRTYNEGMLHSRKDDPAIPTSSYVKIAESMYNTATNKDSKTSRINELRLLSPKIRTSSNNSTPSEKLQNLNKSLRNALQPDIMSKEENIDDENESKSSKPDEATAEESDEAANKLLRSLEEEFKKDEDKDHQLEEEFNQAMGTLDKSTEDDVKSYADAPGECHSDLPRSNLLQETKKLPRVLTGESSPSHSTQQQRLEIGHLESKNLDILPNSPSLKRLRNRLNSTALPSPLKRLQEFRESLHSMVHFRGSCVENLAKNNKSSTSAVAASNSRLEVLPKSKSAQASRSSPFEVEASTHDILTATNGPQLPLPRHKVLAGGQNDKLMNSLLSKASLDGETQSRLTFLNSRVDNIKDTIKRIAEGGSGSGEISFSTYGTDTVGDAIKMGQSSIPKKTSKSPKEILEAMVKEQQY